MLKNIALRLKIVLKLIHRAFLHVFKCASTPLLLIAQSHGAIDLQANLPLLNTVIVP